MRKISVQMCDNVYFYSEELHERVFDKGYVEVRVCLTADFPIEI